MSKTAEKPGDQPLSGELSSTGVIRRLRKREAGTDDEPVPPTGRGSSSAPPEAPRRLSSARPSADAIRESTARAVLDALGLERGRLALLVDPAYEKLGSALARAAESDGLSVETHAVDAERFSNEAFMGRIVAALRDVSGAVYLAPPTGIASQLRAALFRSGGARRDALLLGIDDRIAMHDLASLAAELEGVASRIEALCRNGKMIRVEGLGGTDLQIGVSAAVPWHHDVGRLDAPGLLVLPPGRTLFSPSNVNGTLAPDGGVLLPGEEVRSAATKLRLHFEQGRLVGGEGPLAERLFSAARAVPNGTMIGQVVFGTNPAVLTPIGHEGQDLTTPGLHIVLGDSRPEHTHAVFCATTSITLGVRRADVTVDGEPLFVRGKFASGLLS